MRLEKAGRRAVIINADASQVYRDLTVLSARPEAMEMAGIDHRLYGYRDGTEPFSAADWAADARFAITDAHRQNAIPILVGGTGMYLRTLFDGIAPIPDIDAKIRQQVRALSTADAYESLVQEDPVAANELHRNDSNRTQRALEVIRSSNRSITVWREEKVGGISTQIALAPLILLPPRDWLYGRCNVRFEQMINNGAITEVEQLLARGLGDNLPVMRAIGIAQIRKWLAGEITRKAMIADGQMETRRYAKRQYTWFGNQSDQSWHRFEGIINIANTDKLVTKLYNSLLT